MSRTDANRCEPTVPISLESVFHRLQTVRLAFTFYRLGSVRLNFLSTPNDFTPNGSHSTKLVLFCEWTDFFIKLKFQGDFYFLPLKFTVFLDFYTIFDYFQGDFYFLPLNSLFFRFLQYFWLFFKGIFIFDL